MNCNSFCDKNKDWHLLEARVKLRDSSKCTRCHKRKNLSVHHLKARELGGLDEERNLVTLCYGCHNYVEQNDPVWTEIKTKPVKFDKHEKRGIWSRQDGMLTFTHADDCECGNC